jgi:sialic acid synthase SpsE
MEIIAEIGQNFNGDMGLAKELIHAAHENGADVVKFQVYDAKELFPKEGNPWYDYNCKTELSKDQIIELSSECDKVDIEFGASVFDCERIDWLETVGIKRYKIASRSINDEALIAKLSATGKPLIVSLGMWEGTEFPKIKAEKVDYLYCVSKYPTELTDLYFDKVDFTKYAGFSDHTVGISASICAFSRGARILEKHFTLDKKAYGPDHEGSMVPEELKQINQYRNELREMLS